MSKPTYFYWCILNAILLEFAWILIAALILTDGIHQDFIVVGAVVDNFIILLEFLVIIWNDRNYLEELFCMSAFRFLIKNSLTFLLWNITRLILLSVLEDDLLILFCLIFVLISVLICRLFYSVYYVKQKSVGNGNPGAIGPNGDSV